MKRSALLFGALMLGVASAANAQGLTMQMSNGWTFSFAGNVNIFAMYQKVSDDGLTVAPGGIVGVGGKGLYYGTGLLPSVASFDAKGKEGNTSLGVHFGFFPQVQCGGNAHDCFGTEFSGASIDMRQVFLTAGGSWGTITAGREIGIYQRQNILNDQTLFGVGGGGIAPRGTTLGRIGFGYVYPNFVPQFTYSSARWPLNRVQHRSDGAQHLWQLHRTDHPAGRSRRHLQGQQHHLQCERHGSERERPNPR